MKVSIVAFVALVSAVVLAVLMGVMQFSLRARQNGVDDCIVQMQSNDDELRSQVNDLTGEVRTNAGKIGGLEEKTVANAVAIKANADEIKKVKETIDKLTRRVEKAEERLGQAEQSARDAKTEADKKANEFNENLKALRLAVNLEAEETRRPSGSKRPQQGRRDPKEGGGRAQGRGRSNAETLAKLGPRGRGRSQEGRGRNQGPPTA